MSAALESGLAIGAAAGLASAATWALGSHLYGLVLGRHLELSAAAANLFKNTVAGTVFALVWALCGWPGPDAPAAGWLALSGFFGFAVGDGLYFAAFALCGVQLAALSGNLIPPIAALLGWWLEGARPSLASFGFMALTFTGIALVLGDPRSRTTSHRTPSSRERRVGLALAALAAFSQAFAIAFGSLGFGDVKPDLMSLLPGTTWRLGGGVLGAIAIGLVVSAFGAGRARGAGLEALARPVLRPSLGRLLLLPTLVAAVINLPMHSFALGALQPGASAVLFATTPLFTLPIGLLLGARYGGRTVVGTLVAFAGVVGVISDGT